MDGKHRESEICGVEGKLRSGWMNSEEKHGCREKLRVTGNRSRNKPAAIARDSADSAAIFEDNIDKFFAAIQPHSPQQLTWH